MEKTTKTIISGTILTSILLFIFFAWFIPEKANSYSEPNEALSAFDSDLVLIPGYKMNNDSLYFFIKNNNSLGASYVREGPFGWKAGLLTWGPMGTNYEDGDLNGVQGHGETLIYGLVKNKVDRYVEVNGKRVKMLNLKMLGDALLQKYGLEDVYLWYYESGKQLDEVTLKVELFDGETNELIDSLDY